MRTSRLGIALSVFTAVGVWAQAPSFDVASVKISQVNNMGGEGGFKPNITVTPDSLSMRNFSLHNCVQWAYNVGDYQVTGPDWIDSQRYDINAKAAGAVNEEELRRMLQSLLADRLKMVFHREIRDLPVFVLTVAKDGLKMKASEGAGESAFQPVKGAGKLAITVVHTSMAQFADQLRSPLQGPVLDETGLKGGFDFTLDVGKYLSLDPGQGTHREGDGPREGGRGGLDGATIETAIVLALRDELGLQLARKKAPVDMIVIEKAEKVPTEN